jgi:ribosomal protein S3
MKINQIVRNYFQKRKYKEEANLREIARLIGYYYLEKNKNTDVKEEYSKTREEIIDLGITQLKLKGNILIITLSRPGLLIGRHGDNITALLNFLRNKLKKNDLRIDIKEDIIITTLLSYDYSYDKDFDLL